MRPNNTGLPQHLTVQSQASWLLRVTAVRITSVQRTSSDRSKVGWTRLDGSLDEIRRRELSGGRLRGRRCDDGGHS